jgi:hypothetical protein
MTKPARVADCAEAQVVSSKNNEMNRNIFRYLLACSSQPLP